VKFKLKVEDSKIAFALIKKTLMIRDFPGAQNEISFAHFFVRKKLKSKQILCHENLSIEQFAFRQTLLSRQNLFLRVIFKS